MSEDVHAPYTNSLATLAKAIQQTMPQIVGIRRDTPVHFQLPVSFLMVIRVVEQGQCISENSIMLIAVIQVQPWSTKRARMASKSDSSRILP